MANKRYSNAGVNAARREQAAAEAAKKNQNQTRLVIAAVLALVLVTAIAMIVVGCVNKDAADADSSTTGEVTTAPSTEPVAPNADMPAIMQEIDSMRVDAFAETAEKSEYVKISVKDHGDIIIRLRADIAPKTVANFQKLVAAKFYDGLTFHRVIKNFMIQGGDPKGDGTGGSDEKIQGEFSENNVQNDLSHVAGVISMARRSDNKDSANSQFFICNADASASLDKKYAAFGYVVAGFEIVLSVSEAKVEKNASGENSKPVEKIIIEKICFVSPVEEPEA